MATPYPGLTFHAPSSPELDLLVVIGQAHELAKAAKLPMGRSPAVVHRSSLKRLEIYSSTPQRSRHRGIDELGGATASNLLVFGHE